MAVAVADAMPEHGSGNGWQGCLELAFVYGPRGTRLAKKRHIGPLYVQRPFYPEGPELAHCYLLHPPGGLVAGDELTTSIDVGEGAGLMLTTPGANRFYATKQERSTQQQINRINIAANASAEWLPLETLIYNGANAAIQTEVVLAKDARYIGWEFNCLGLPASNEPFCAGSFKQSLTIHVEGKPAIIDRLTIADGGERYRNSQAGLRGNSVWGVLVAGPFATDTDWPAAMESLRDIASQNVAITRLGEFVVARYLGDSAVQGRQQFLPLWAWLRQQLLGRAACAPRIWAT